MTKVVRKLMHFFTFVLKFLGKMSSECLSIIAYMVGGGGEEGKKMVLGYNVHISKTLSE